MLPVATMVESLVGLMGGEVDSPLKRDQQVLEAANRFVENANDPNAEWLAELCEHIGEVTNQMPRCIQRNGANETCFTRERKRKFNQSKVRPIHAYSETKMCDACRIHWHITMAGVLLRQVAMMSRLDFEKER